MSRQPHKSRTRRQERKGGEREGTAQGNEIARAVHFVSRPPQRDQRSLKTNPLGFIEQLTVSLFVWVMIRPLLRREDTRRRQ